MYNLMTESLIFILPEIIILLGILVLLILKMCNLKDMRLMSHCAIPFLIASAYILIRNYLYTGVGHAFSDAITHDTFVYFAQLFLLIASILIFLMLAGSEKMQPEIPALLLASVLGSMVIIASNDFIVLYLGLELASLSLYVCVASRTTNNFSLESGIKYFILGSSVSGIYLFGAALIYISSGCIDFDQIAAANPFAQLITGDDAGILAIPMAFWVGIIMIIISLCFKLSIAPFHTWAPDVYQGAPTVITAFIGSISKISAACIMVKLVCNVFDLMISNIQQILVIVAVISMIVGSLGGIMQKSVKRMLAYSTVTHMGFILAALAAVSSDGLNNTGTVGAMNYLIIYVICIVIPTFTSITYLVRIHDITIKQLSGLKSRSPVIAASLAMLMLSSIGIPPLPGFFAKFYVVGGLVDAEMYGIASFLVIMSVLSSFYYLRVIKYMYFTEDESELASNHLNGEEVDHAIDSNMSGVALMASVGSTGSERGVNYREQGSLWELKVLMAIGFMVNIAYPLFAIDRIFNISRFMVDVLF